MRTCGPSAAAGLIAGGPTRPNTEEPPRWLGRGAARSVFRLAAGVHLCEEISHSKQHDLPKGTGSHRAIGIGPCISIVIHTESASRSRPYRA